MWEAERIGGSASPRRSSSRSSEKLLDHGLVKRQSDGG
jgi:hypothetical protein